MERTSKFKIEEIVGQKYHMLEIIGYVRKFEYGHRVMVRCDCGVEKEVTYGNLRSGQSKSCGCLVIIKAAKMSQSLITHHKYNHKLYRVWHGMMNRCYKEKDVSYHNYGGRGVIVFEEWKNNFMSFFNWAVGNGWQDGLQLDKDILYNKKHGTDRGMIYSPEYCCFVTPKKNAWDRYTTLKVEYKGEIKPLPEWCEILGVKNSLVQRRIWEGWSVEDALGKPPTQRGVKLKLNGFSLSLSEWSKKLGVARQTLENRIKKGWNLEKVLQSKKYHIKYK